MNSETISKEDYVVYYLFCAGFILGVDGMAMAPGFTLDTIVENDVAVQFTVNCRAPEPYSLEIIVDYGVYQL